MKKVCENRKIVDLLTNESNSSATPDELVKTHIYPFEFIPGTTE